MIVVQELARNWNEPDTCPNAWLTCWNRPNVSAPAMIDGPSAAIGMKLASCR
jgi:hypothetical protein